MFSLEHSDHPHPHTQTHPACGLCYKSFSIIIMIIDALWLHGQYFFVKNYNFLLNQLQIDSLTDVALQLGVDKPTEAALGLALSDLRLKVAKLPVENFQRMQRASDEKLEHLENLQGLGESEDVLRKAEADSKALEAEMKRASF